jgi:hypothetical protein
MISGAAARVFTDEGRAHRKQIRRHFPILIGRTLTHGSMK